MPMTPAERQYDTDLVRSMRETANWVAARSGKVALVLRQGADRLELLSTTTPVVDPEITAASNTARVNTGSKETVRENGRG
jgi:hypothetical protein